MANDVHKYSELPGLCNDEGVGLPSSVDRRPERYLQD